MEPHLRGPGQSGDDGVGDTANSGRSPSWTTRAGSTSPMPRRTATHRLTGAACSASTEAACRSVPGADRQARAVVGQPGRGRPPPNKNARIPLSPSMDFSPRLGALVYVVQNNVNSASSGADITGTFSTDYGTTWQNMQNVSHVGSSASAAPGDQFFPWVSVDKSGGIHVIWFDNRNDPSNTLIETWELITKSLSFARRTSTSAQRREPNNAFFSSGSFIGDYNGLDADQESRLSGVDRRAELPRAAAGRGRHLHGLSLQIPLTPRGRLHRLPHFGSIGGGARVWAGSALLRGAARSPAAMR